MSRPKHATNNSHDQASIATLAILEVLAEVKMAFRPRISIRYIMAIVLFIAVILALAIPAVEVYRTKEYHTHLGK
jgi:hypothetical protein